MAAKRGTVIIKKYGNRRLYDTEDSTYLTQDELARKIRGGADVRVVDAKSGDDLTQATLTQIIIEGRGAGRLLPVPLLVQLIRMGDDALSEFLGNYVGASLDLYLRMKRGAERIAPYNPFATLPFAATDALARLFTSNPPSAAPSHDPASYEPPPYDDPLEERRPSHDDVADLRREIDELKRTVEGQNASAESSTSTRTRKRKRTARSSS